MGKETAILISVVVPVYNDEKCIDVFLEKAIPVLESVTGDFEIIFALDPSPDRSEEVILGWRQKEARIKLLKFSRRVGQPMATLAGLQYSTGEAVVVIDVDLQDPPELIKDLAAKWREGFDVVLARRQSRDGDTWLKRLTSFIGYKIINRIADPPIPPETGDFRLMSRRVVNEINRLKECHGFLRGLVAVVGFKQTSIPYDRPARVTGETHYNRFWGSLRIGFNGMICFSNSLLSLSAKAGFLIAGFSFLMGIVYFFMKIFGFPFPIGNPTIVILILFMGGIQLVSVGILGEYIARIYEEVKQRPKFIIDQAVGFKHTESSTSEQPSDISGTH
jgi:dolichol-phosphate mannosyltransferase